MDTSMNNVCILNVKWQNRSFHKFLHQSGIYCVCGLDIVVGPFCGETHSFVRFFRKLVGSEVEAIRSIENGSYSFSNSKLSNID